MSRLDEIDDVPDASIASELALQRKRRDDSRLPQAIPIAETVREAGEQQRLDYERLKRLESEYQAGQRSGKVEVDLPLSRVHPSRFTNRSSYYFSTERYRRIRQSIEDCGQQLPIKVRPAPDTDGNYEIVYGYSRYRAHLDLRLPTIRAVIEVLSDSELLLQMERENGVREDLSPYEQAVFYQQMLEVVYQGDREALCKATSRSNSWLSQQISIAGIPSVLLDAYPLLHEAPVLSLLGLARVLRDYANCERLLVNKDRIKATDPKLLAYRLLKELAKTPRRERPKPRKFTTTNGEILVVAKPLGVGGEILQFSKGQEGFAQYVYSRLNDLYEIYKKE